MPAFEKNGVKLALFDEIIDMWGGPDKLVGLSSTDVNNIYQKESTKHSQSSMVTLLLSDSHSSKYTDMIGPANVFISHAWKYTFLAVVEALKNHFHCNPDIFVWFDLFCNNQHSAADLPFEWWTGVFSSSIQKIGHTVMILSPWDAPITLTRAWCLYEVYCTVQMKSRFEIAMCNDEKHDFIQALTNRDSYHKISEMIANIDVENSGDLHHRY